MSARGGELESAFAFGIVRQLFEGTLASADSQTGATPSVLTAGWVVIALVIAIRRFRWLPY